MATDPETGVYIDPNQIGEGQLTEEQMIYKENILDHYKHPHHKRLLQHPTNHYRDLNPLCGDTIEVTLAVRDGVVQEIGFDGRGCAISQASMSILSDEIKGKSVDEVLKMKREDVLGLLNIPIGVVRMKCAMLGLRTTQKALGG